MPLVYLAGPIDAVSRESALGWRGNAASSLGYFGIATFNPAAAFVVGRTEQGGRTAFIGKWIDEINRHAIERSAALFARILPEERVFGTIREIEYARARPMPVVLIAPHLREHFTTWDLIVVSNLEEGIKATKEVLESEAKKHNGSMVRDPMDRLKVLAGPHPLG